MSLIKCPECGKEISDKSNACIHCGYKISSKNKMVKYKMPIFIIAFVVLVSFSSIYITNRVPDGFSKEVYKAGKAYIKIAEEYIDNGGDVNEELIIPDQVEDVFSKVSDKKYSSPDDIGKDDELCLLYMMAGVEYSAYVCGFNKLDDFEEYINEMKELMELQ